MGVGVGVGVGGGGVTTGAVNWMAFPPEALASVISLALAVSAAFSDSLDAKKPEACVRIKSVALNKRAAATANAIYIFVLDSVNKDLMLALVMVMVSLFKVMIGRGRKRFLM